MYIYIGPSPIICIWQPEECVQVCMHACMYVNIRVYAHVNIHLDRVWHFTPKLRWKYQREITIWCFALLYFPPFTPPFPPCMQECATKWVCCIILILKKGFCIVFLLTLLPFLSKYSWRAQLICICVCVCIHVCMCMYTCVHTCMYVCIYVCRRMCVCVCTCNVYMFGCLCIRMYVYMRVYAHICV